MTHVTGRLTAKNRDQLRNPTLGNRVWATFTFFTWLLVWQACNAHSKKVDVLILCAAQHRSVNDSQQLRMQRGTPCISLSVHTKRRSIMRCNIALSPGLLTGFVLKPHGGVLSFPRSPRPTLLFKSRVRPSCKACSRHTNLNKLI